jgi:hypothetical protein
MKMQEVEMPKKAKALPVPAFTSEQAKLARRWKRGMDAANELEIDELRRMTIAEKARQIGILMGGAKSFDWAEKVREGEDEVRALWVELKRRHAAQK